MTPSLPLRILVFLLGFSLPVLADDEGRLQSIDPKAYTLTITRGLITNSYHWRASVEVKLEGQRADPKDLIPGMMLKIKTSETGVAARILAGPPTSFDQKLFPGPMICKVPGHSLTITGSITGADALKVQAGSIWWEHLSAAHHAVPDKLTINGVEWIPNWNGRTSTKLTFQPELEGFAAATPKIEKVSGRPRLKIEMPSAENNATLTVQLTDGEAGSGDAEVQIQW